MCSANKDYTKTYFYANVHKRKEKRKFPAENAEPAKKKRFTQRRGEHRGEGIQKKKRINRLLTVFAR